MFAGAIALCLILLGMLPWSRTGTPWRPHAPAREELARAHWDDETIAHGREYRSNGYALFFLRRGVRGLALVLAIGLGLHLALRRLPLRGTIWAPALALVACEFVLDLIGIPFGLAALASRRAFGLSTQSTALWFADLGKGVALSALTTAIVGAVLFYLITRLPRAWPYVAGFAAALGGAFYALILPIVIAPLFNTFTPLADAELSARFLDLARRGGVPVSEVTVMDASRRTRSLNAYVSGFGPSRQVVVYDTLIETLPPGEAAQVVAHEIGHWKLAHIAKGIALGALVLMLALALARRLLALLVARGWWGITSARDPAIAPVLILLYWVASFASLPIENAVSRRFETEADRFSIALTQEPAAHVAVEESMARRNLADVVPPPFIEWLLFTHPATLDRIALARPGA